MGLAGRPRLVPDVPGTAPPTRLEAAIAISGSSGAEKGSNSAASSFGPQVTARPHGLLWSKWRGFEPSSSSSASLAVVVYSLRNFVGN
jgi:hypothetical protein